MPRRLGDRPLTSAEKSQRFRARHRDDAPRRTQSEGIRETNQLRRQAEAAERGPLFRRMADEMVGNLALTDLTVMAERNDPYRLDTAANHALGQWFAAQVARTLPDDISTVHLRGLHYRLVALGDVRKPNGEVYRNTDKDYAWFGEQAAKAARWLGYVDFERIVDERNAEPEIYCLGSFFTSKPHTSLSQGFGIYPTRLEDIALDDLVPSLNLAMPRPICSSSAPPQPYRLVFIGEKVSLRPILLPIAERVRGELILPTGELSDTLLYNMAERAAQDDRPTVVLYFSDFDPAGHAMPVNVSRKLQALRDLRFPDLDVAVHAVALTFQQVRDLDLPSTPLKETEKRRDHWREHWGREQTEIDALAALRPAELRRIAEQAIEPFYDPTLERRWRAIDTDWSIRASRAMQAHPLYAETRAALAPHIVSAEQAIEDFRGQCQEFRERLQGVADALERAQREAAERMNIAIPEPYEMPIAELPPAPEPLYSSREDWREATEKLIAYRRLVGLGAEP